MTNVSVAEKVRREVLLLILLPLLLMFTCMAVLTWQVKALVESSQSFAATESVLTRLFESHKLTLDFETALRGFLLTGNEVFLDPYKEAESEWRDALGAAEESYLSVMKTGGDKFDRLRELYVDWFIYAQKAVSVRRDQGLVWEETKKLTGKKMMDDIREVYAGLIEHIQQKRERERTFVEKRAQLTIGLSVVAAVLTMIFFVFIIRTRVSSISRIYQLQAADLRILHEDLQAANVHLENRVEERTAAYKAANSELEAFCYSVSHDLRAPLRGIDGFSQALKEDYAEKLDSMGVGYLNFIREGVQKMGHLIDDLLNLSRITRVEIRRKSCDVSAMAEAAYAELKRLEPKRQVNFKCQPGMQDDIDEGLGAIVFTNLLSNALKFTSKQENAVIEVGQSQIDGQDYYFVRDNGAGFNMKYAAKLFNAFQRLHSAQDYSGTGIGLATIQRIVNKHGGRVWAEGEIGKGAKFYFSFNSSGGNNG